MARELGVAARFDHVAIVEHQDLVRIHHRREPVGDAQRRPPCGIRTMWIADSGGSGSGNPEEVDH
jgi:hypothetical protein